MRIAKVERKIEYFPIIGGDIKATNDAQGIIEGYLNYIGNIDYGDDRTMKGAFRNTIRDSFARKSQQGLDYLWPYLWNHDYNQLPPGGIFDADETSKGLYTKTQFNLDIQLGRELYSSFKVGTMKKQSMGYKAIQVEYVKDEKVGRTIRNLLEVAVMEGSAVVFPMNDLAQVDLVKQLRYKPSRSTFYMGMNTKGSASGKTTWPLADRATTWDAGQAKKDIEAWAGDDTGKMAQCFFWVAKSPPEKLGDCKLPFVAKVGGVMKAVPQGIISSAGVIQGAMGGANIDDVDAVKKKVASYYGKMMMKPPWEKGKGNEMDILYKDYAADYQETIQQDWVSDLWNLWYPLRNAFIAAMQTGDTPVEDARVAIGQFTEAALAYMERGVELDMMEYLQPDDDAANPTYGYMTADDNPMTKKLSASSHAKLMKAVDGIAGHVKEMKSELSRQRANALQGYQVYSSSEDDPPQQKQDDDDDEATQANKRREALYDLTAKLQFQNAARGI